MNDSNNTMGEGVIERKAATGSYLFWGRNFKNQIPRYFVLALSYCGILTDSFYFIMFSQFYFKPITPSLNSQSFCFLYLQLLNHYKTGVIQ